MVFSLKVKVFNYYVTSGEFELNYFPQFNRCIKNISIGYMLLNETKTKDYNFIIGINYCLCGRLGFSSGRKNI